MDNIQQKLLSMLAHRDTMLDVFWQYPKIMECVVVSSGMTDGRLDEFLQAMEEMRSFRHKDGAVRWGIFRDLADPDRYLETFLVTTWAEHLRQHARVTVDDQETEAHAFSFLQSGVEPVATHLFDARTFASQKSTGMTRAEMPIRNQLNV